MTKFIDRNRKQILAVFCVLLMIMFILPSSFKGGQSMAHRPHVAGMIGTEKVYSDDLVQAHREWELVNQRIFVSDGRGGGVPLARAMLRWGAIAIQQTPDAFYLLQREAERMSIVVPEDAIESTRDATTGSQDADPQLVHEAIKHLLMVNAALGRAQNVVKISEPIRQVTMARSFQKVVLNIADIPASKFDAAVPAPTTQQSADQFAKYRDVEADRPTAENPFGFGYKCPDQIGLQYITIKQAEVQRAVKQSKADFDWEVDARMYYKKHPDQFKATPTSLPSSIANPDAPTTRPFEEVSTKILDIVMKPDVDKLTERVQNKVVQILHDDWTAYHKAVGEVGNAATQPTTGVAMEESIAEAATPPAGPVSSLGVPFNSSEYLARLGDEIQKDSGVRITVVNFADRLLIPKELADEKIVEGLAKAALIVSGEQVDFATYAIFAGSAFERARNDHSDLAKEYALAPMQPSAILRNASQDRFLFRLTKMIPTHQPAGIAQVQDRVVADLRKAAAFDQAHAAATAFLEKAKAATLTSEAKAENLPVKSAGPFLPRQITGGMIDTIPGYTALPASALKLADAAIALLSDPAQLEHKKPMSIVDLHADNKVAVVELDTVTPVWTAGEYQMADARAEMGAMNQFLPSIMEGWCTYAAVADRVGYVPTEAPKTPPPVSQVPPPSPLF